MTTISEKKSTFCDFSPKKYLGISYSISTVLQAQIFDDVNASFENRGHQRDFDHIPILPPEHGGDVVVLPGDFECRESQHDDELRTQLIAGVVPTVETIYRYNPSIIQPFRHVIFVAKMYDNFILSLSMFRLFNTCRVAIFYVNVICYDNQLCCILNQ